MKYFARGRSRTINAKAHATGAITAVCFVKNASANRIAPSIAIHRELKASMTNIPASVNASAGKSTRQKGDQLWNS